MTFCLWHPKYFTHHSSIGSTTPCSEIFEYKEENTRFSCARACVCVSQAATVLFTRTEDEVYRFSSGKGDHRRVNTLPDRSETQAKKLIWNVDSKDCLFSAFQVWIFAQVDWQLQTTTMHGGFKCDGMCYSLYWVGFIRFCTQRLLPEDQLRQLFVGFLAICLARVKCVDSGKNTTREFYLCPPKWFHLTRQIGESAPFDRECCYLLLIRKVNNQAWSTSRTSNHHGACPFDELRFCRANGWRSSNLVPHMHRIHTAWHVGKPYNNMQVQWITCHEHV